MAAPSLKQCAARVNAYHREALRYRTAGRPIFEDRQPSESEVRGMETAISTLYRWGCLDHQGVTARGRELWDMVRNGR